MKSGALVIVALAGTLLARVAVAEVASWKYLVSVGGFSIGHPKKVARGWVLPVQGDVSGLRTITAKPTTMNSSVACVETQASVEGKTISVRVITGIGGPGRSASCPPANLGPIAPGSYFVQYVGSNEAPVPLGNVVIAP
jgi:hypothetical protein